MDGRHLVRVHTFGAARVDSCHHVIVGLAGLHGSVDEGGARVCRGDADVGSSGRTPAVNIISHHVRLELELQARSTLC